MPIAQCSRQPESTFAPVRLDMCDFDPFIIPFKEIDGGFATDQEIAAETDGYSYDDDSDIGDDDLHDDATEPTIGESTATVCHTIPCVVHVIHSGRQDKEKDAVADGQATVALSKNSMQSSGIKHTIVIPDVAANTCVFMFCWTICYLIGSVNQLAGTDILYLHRDRPFCATEV